MNHNNIVDSPEQTTVIHAASDRDMLVVAGAGSGKTYTMTRRIIALIDGGVPPEKIVGLTFTRKAASELLARVSQAVIGGDEHSLDTGRANRAFLKPEVSTYDAFFQSIVRQYGLLVGFDQNTQPLSDAGRHQIAADVVDAHRDLLIERNFGAFGTVTDQLLALCAAISGSMIGDGCSTLAEAIAKIRAWDEAFSSRLDGAIGDDPIPEDEPHATLKARKKTESDAEFQQRVEAHRALQHSLCVYRCDQLRQTVRKRETLLALVEEYDRAKHALGMAEFSDFTIAAYQLVTRFPSIGEQYRRRYGHVLLDEYQDTSTTQSILLASLFHPENGTTDRSAVNAVGDPFQSIYAWRGASPGALRMFQQRFGIGPRAKPYTLSTTRRNARVVLQAANALTAALRNAPRRPSSSRMREVGVPPLNALDQAREGTVGVVAYETLGQEIDGVARFAKHAIARHAEGMPDTGRPHVAVLFRSKTQMPRFEQGLQRAGLSTVVVGYSALFERPEIRDIRALLRVTADHSDAAALMRLLATPRFGIGADDLSALSALAQARNMEYRFRALAQAGVASPDTPRSEWGDVVAQHREDVPNGVFLADVLADEHLGSMLRHRQDISGSGRKAMERMGVILRRVHSVLGRPLPDVIRTAVEALNLDIDAVLAQAINGSDRPIEPATARVPVESLVALVDTYQQELSTRQIPSLRGFVAWLETLGNLEQESAEMPREPADVVLMTIHQSKGLEWDAVAIPTVTERSFPSSQGDNLGITPDEHHPGRSIDGVWEPPEYHESAATWLTSPSAVPVPVRADAEILPRFPHDAETGGDGCAALGGLTDVERIDEEVFGDLRDTHDPARRGDLDDESSSIDRDDSYLTQGEEYGRRLHADERRLAYVALTRAREEVLITSSRYTTIGRDPRATLPGQRAAKPSNIWNEVHDSLVGGAQSAIDDFAGLDGPAGTAHTRGVPDADAAPTLASARIEPPQGVFAGEAAREYAQAVIGEAWHAPLEDEPGEGALGWPAELTSRVASVLRRSAEIVERRMRIQGSADADDLTPVVPHERSLLVRARMLIDDADLMQTDFPGLQGASGQPSSDEDERVRRQAEHVLTRHRQNVTSLQARAGNMDERQARAYWRALVRPIPRVASPAAEQGTLFHAWAEQFIAAFGDDEAVDDTLAGDGAMGRIASGSNAPSRHGLLRDLALLGDDDRDAGVNRRQVRRLVQWERRLAQSRWAGRRPFAVERQIVAAFAELGGIIVNGKLDAVFYGGLDENDPGKRFTVVDWKTGAKPKTAKDRERKLAQLDMYRLLLSEMEHVPLASVDATLYYLSESDERSRELHARAKTRGEIVDELSAGIPAQSDND